ncbi:HET-domain-containing protein [Hortaea werneckii]|nr:HET-domain-containing protein [Hortaea werneckii]KAI7718279.1 HET-domain-containing protein [Hortaea werneckii]
MSTFDFARHCPLPSTLVDGSSGFHRISPAGFRVLKIKPGSWDSEIECNLLSCLITSDNSVQRFPPYHALSYHWGPAGGRHMVRILVDSNAYSIQIRRNLHTALRRLRSTQVDVHLWVDALCVDQENKDEKSSQIPLMRLIFSRANSVKVWLGEAAADSDRAMDFIKTCATSDSFNKLIKDNSTPADWAALSTLMRRPWFSRRWIIQEIALGKCPELICGEKSVPWQDFADVISMAAYKQSELQRLFRSSITYQNHPDYLGDLSELGAIRLAQLSDEFFLKGEDGSTQQRLFTLEGLMSSLTAFEASDPHDILYAILWLASDAVPNFKASPSSTTLLVQSPASLIESPTMSHCDLEDRKGRSRSATAEIAE